MPIMLTMPAVTAVPITLIVTMMVVIIAVIIVVIFIAKAVA